jgi:hypothetical protein
MCNPCARLFTPDSISSGKHMNLLFFRQIPILFSPVFIILSREQEKGKRKKRRSYMASEKSYRENEKKKEKGSMRITRRRCAFCIHGTISIKVHVEPKKKKKKKRRRKIVY